MTSITTAVTPAYASPADPSAHGEYRVHREPDDPRPVYRFDGRIGTDLPAEPGRYHLYGGWFCPWSQRVTTTLALLELEQSITVSYVHGERDGRGWAFREPTGADPVNSFTLLREAYERTEPGFDGHVSVPTLWDRARGQVVSNTFAHLDVDVASRFPSDTDLDLYPEALRGQIEALEAELTPALNQGVGVARQHSPEGQRARAVLVETLGRLDRELAGSRYLLGDQLTLADVRVFVTLARFDAQSNHDGLLGPALTAYRELWDYARHLYHLPAVRATTRFETFTAAVADLPDWDQPARRDRD